MATGTIENTLSDPSPCFLPFTSGIEPPWVQSAADPLPHTTLPYSKVDHRPALAFPNGLDTPKHHADFHWPPVPDTFGNSFDGGFDFDAMCKSLTPSTLFASMAGNPFDQAFQQETAALSPGTDVLSTISDGSGTAGSPGLEIQNDDTIKHASKRRRVCTEQKKACMASALKILQTLHIPPAACLSSQDEAAMPRQPRMIDSVLSTNKEVIRSVSDIVDCSCAGSSQVQLLLAIICGKLIAWYRAIIRVYPNGGNGETLSSMLPPALNKDSGGEEGRERVLHQPVTVGGYSCGIEVESKVRAQVVFGELQHLESLIENISNRGQEPTRQCSAATSDMSSLPSKQSGLADAVQRSLSSFLQGQLQAAKADTTPVLRGVNVPA